MISAGAYLAGTGAYILVRASINHTRRMWAARLKNSVLVVPAGTPATPLSVGGAVYHQPSTSGIRFSHTPSMAPRSTSAPGQLKPLWEAQGSPDVWLQAVQLQSPVAGLPSFETMLEPLLHQLEPWPGVAGQPLGPGG